jgi:hypothetical protein
MSENIVYGNQLNLEFTFTDINEKILNWLINQTIAEKKRL